MLQWMIKVLCEESGLYCVMSDHGSVCDCSQHTLHYEMPRGEMICCVDQTETASFGGKTGLCTITY